MAKKKEINKGLNKYGKMKATTEHCNPVNLDTFDPYDAPTYPTVDFWELEFKLKHGTNFRIKVRPRELLEAYAIPKHYIGITLINIWSVHKVTKSLTLDEFREKYQDIFIDPRSV